VADGGVGHVLKDLIELLAKLGGLPFEYPLLFPVTVVGISATAARGYANAKYVWTPSAPKFIRRWTLEFAKAWLVSVLLLAPAAWLIYRYVGLPPVFAKDEIGILVAEVLDQPNSEQQTAYQNAIIDRIRSIQQLRDVVKVRLIERPFPFDLVEQQTEALKIGRWLGASFVLRPFSVEGMQEPRLTVVNNPYFLNSESRIGGKFQNAQLANLDQLSLPSDLVLLAETSLALAFDERQSYDKAAQILGDVLKSPKLPDAAPSRSELNLICADDLYLSGKAIEAIAEYREAIRLKPDFAEAHINMGFALEHTGQYDVS
jgi:tetratricopeptide (TPR) repeat protein